jgi:hypothetical protein
MMKRALLVLVMVLAILPFVRATDPLESLIQSENKAEATEDNAELPTMFLFGDRNAVKIYSAGTRTLTEMWVCRGLELDELVQMSRGDSTQNEIEINLSIPRVRKMFEDACLIRPGDFVMALASGFQTPVTVKRFFVRRDAVHCPKESPLSLWGSFDEILEQSPFLFSTNLDLPEGDNSLKLLNGIADVRVDDNIRKALKSKIPFLDDFDISGKPLEDSQVQMLIHVRRRIVETDDDGLPNELLFALRGDDVEEIWVERVDLQSGSGHIRPWAVWDYNGDGHLDILIEGDHQKCLYQMLLTGGETSFGAEDMPTEPCGC